VVVYAVDTDDNYKDVYAYKINRIDRYFEVAESFKDEVRVRAETGKQYTRYFR